MDAKTNVPVGARPVGSTTAPRIAAISRLLPCFEHAQLLQQFDLKNNWNDMAIPFFCRQAADDLI